MSNKSVDKFWFDPFTFGKQAVGFESLFDRIREAQEYAVKAPNYPPFNIKRVDENRYVIELAVAGFGKQNLDIELTEDVLTVTGRIEAEESDYVHKGIADRAFTRKFTLADTVEVKNAELINGMLKVYLERFVPDEKKPKKIDIMDPFGVGETTKQLLNEGTKQWSDTMSRMGEAYDAINKMGR